MGLFSFGGNSQQDADDDQTPVRPRRSARTPEDEPMDPMLPEKKRARRRLIGVTALVLAAVIALFIGGLIYYYYTRPKLRAGKAGPPPLNH